MALNSLPLLQICALPYVWAVSTVLSGFLSPLYHHYANILLWLPGILTFICLFVGPRKRERDRMVHLLVLSPPVCNLWGLTRAEVRSRELYWNLIYGWREVSYWSHHLRNEKQKLCSFLSLAARLHYLLTLISFSSSNPIRISFSQPGLESSCNDSHSTHNHYIVGSVPHTQPALNGTGIIISVWTLSSLALSGSSSLPEP